MANRMQDITNRTKALVSIRECCKWLLAEAVTISPNVQFEQAIADVVVAAVR